MDITMQLNETKIDTSKIYFHGSSEARVQTLEAPSYEHPFYISPDLHYAMAFCTKDSSSTGEYSIKKEFTPFSQNFVYVVTLNPSCKVFDFRNHDSAEFKKIYKIIDKDLVDWIKIVNASGEFGEFNLNDIYEFIAALELIVIKPVDESHANYLEYGKLYAKSKNQMSPKMFLKACSFVKKNGLYGASKNYDTHQIMAPVLKGLHTLGFYGVLTVEHDYNEEIDGSSALVTTDYAIGIFDKNGLDMLSLVPMKYEWLKKINPSYLDNHSVESSTSKVKRFIQLYKSIASKQRLHESIERLQLKNNVPESEFKKMMSTTEVSNKHFNVRQFEKLYDADYSWSVLLDNGKCVAAAALLEDFGPVNGMTYVNELQSLVSGSNYGKKILLALQDSYDKLWLMADASVKSDVLLKFYRDPEFNFAEYVLPARESRYEVDTHIFAPKNIADNTIWNKFLKQYFGNEEAVASLTESMHISQTMYRFCIGNVGVYEAAKDLIFSRFDADEAKKKWYEVLAASSWLPKPDFQYSKEYESWFTLAGKTMFEKTVLPIIEKIGIDSIEMQKSTIADSNIVYSDIYQAIVKLDKINENNENDINDIKYMFDEVVSQYKTTFGIDLSYMAFKVDSQPVYTNGEPCYEYDEDECAGDWTSLGWIRLNPDMQSVMDRYGVAWHGSDDIEEFTKFIIAHELAHEVWNNIASDQFKNDVIEKANDENFSTVYLETVNTNKLAEETFCEYLAHEIVQQRKKIDFPEEEIQDLSRRKHIVTHRVSDDALLFNVGDIVDAPWQIPYKITKKNVVNDIYDSPYVDQLSQEQLEYLEQFDNIAILDLIAQYEPPYSLEQIKSKYPEHVYNKLANDPVHRWRAETGIELIHREPTEKEQQRTWKNWQLMSQNMKDISDKKSIELFGCTNAEHYLRLKSN